MVADASLHDPRTARRAGALPPEFRGFLSSDIPQSLSVRGAPGVGKTSLSLALLAGFPGARTLISTRVPLESIRRQFTWLPHVPGPPIRMLEFIRFRSPAARGVESIEHLRQTLEARATDLVDISHVLNLPQVLQDHLAMDPAGPRLIALDSWEAYVENVLGSSSINLDLPTTRWELERSMLDQLLATGASVLMVVEREERSRFDYITDGSLLLTHSEFEGREERWLEITKLRGVRIESRSYPFTLEEARFRAILPPPGWSPHLKPAEPDPDPRVEYLWPGSADFAREFGRLPAPGLLLIEADPETPVRMLWRLAAPVVESALRAGGHAVVRPPGVLGLREVWEGLRAMAVPAVLGDALRVIVPEESLLPEGSPAGIFAVREPVGPAAVGGRPEDGELAGSAELAQFLAASGPVGLHNLVVVFPSTLVDLRPERLPDPYLRLPAAARRRGAEFSTLVVMRSDDPFLNEARARAATHLVVRARRGQVVAYGVRPWTPSYVVRPGVAVDGGGPPYELVPMV